MNGRSRARIGVVLSAGCLSLLLAIGMTPSFASSEDPTSGTETPAVPVDTQLEDLASGRSDLPPLADPGDAEFQSVASGELLQALRDGVISEESARIVLLQASIGTSSSPGLRIDDDGTSTVMIFSDTPIREAEKIASSLSARVEVSQFDRAGFDELLTKVTGLPIGPDDAYAIGYDPVSDTVEIRGRVDTEPVADAISSGRITHVEDTKIGRASRDSDAAPHAGGVRWKSASSPEDFDCTLGLAVRHPDTGAQFAVTAAHCRGVGTQAFSPAGQSLGWVSSIPNFPSVDVAAIDGSTYEGYVYTGTTDVGLRQRVVAVADPVLSQTTCQGGGRSLESCGTETSTNTQFRDALGITQNLVLTSATARLGDSGAPVYRKESYGNVATGTVVARGVGTFYSHKWSTIRDTFRTNSSTTLEIVTN